MVQFGDFREVIEPGGGQEVFLHPDRDDVAAAFCFSKLFGK